MEIGENQINVTVDEPRNALGRPLGVMLVTRFLYDGPGRTREIYLE